jgi:hypothetical protein
VAHGPFTGVRDSTVAHGRVTGVGDSTVANGRVTGVGDSTVAHGRVTGVEASIRVSRTSHSSLDTLQTHTGPMDASRAWRPQSVSHRPVKQAWTLFSLVRGSRTRHGRGSPDPSLMDPSPQVWTLFSLVRGPQTSHRRGGVDPCLTDPSPKPRHSSTLYEAHGLITGALSLTYGSRSTYMIKNTP